MVTLLVLVVVFNVVSTMYIGYRVLTRFSSEEINTFMDRINAPKQDGVTSVF